jgi:hypothetical protein
MGDWRSGEIEVGKAEADELRLQTPGGRIRVRWDHGAKASPNAQLAFLRSFWK